ncbi:2-polyprenylphenol 6-hydroxylase [Defluviicoccus vanus]|uniref:2-polyprenylphenol 6-hydroxylase n=1 Tax=Defluviicoccus vanus TaxID=111831 RepID=A0A7H1N1J4_9PROT|nr:2-polyprenylphenol 6-hydroxylase [Defluviicoccus vanus]QNT69580.1 2-polyprenylphenol 6-hydroxylase [Defluviicoccus vanus]
MLQTLRNLIRMLSLVRTLARQDALAPLLNLPLPPLVRPMLRAISTSQPGRPGEKLARALVAAGPSFIKLGQALSTRADLFGDDFAADLAHLQDRLPPFPAEEARAIIAAELGAPIETLFRRFDDQPVAAASIAQVHFAETTEGRAVAVKVLRPDVEAAFRRDLDLFRWGAKHVERVRPEFIRLRPVETVALWAESVAMEMDLRMEAAAASELAQNFADDRNFYVPAVDWSRTGQRVLTLERVTGIPIYDRERLVADGFNPEKILAIAAESFFRQVFRDGFFHADLHPGNMFVQPDGRVAVVDFGIMGRIDRADRRHLAELLLAFLSRDFKLAADVHFRAGWIPRDRSVAAFAQACRSIAEPILDKPQNEISVAHLLSHLFRVTETFGMAIQPQLLLLQKTMLVAEGTGRALCPDINMWTLARPMIADWMQTQMRPDVRLREMAEDLGTTATRITDAVRLAEKGAALLAEGRIRLHPETMASLAGNGGNFGQWLPWIIAAAAVGYAMLH